MSNQRFATRRSRIRTKVAVGAVCAGILGASFVTEQASAAAPAPQMAGAVAPAQGPAADSSGALAMAAPVAVHGVADDGSELFGTFQLERLQTHGGVLYAVGDLAGTLGTRSVTKHNVRIPVILGSEPSTAVAGLHAAATDPTPGACSILTLNLGRLDLNLLGLHVVLDPVSLLVEAVPGAGALVGNLLCAVTNLLNGVGLGGLVTNLLTAITNLLNGLLAV